MQYAIIGAGGTGGVMGYFMTKAGKDVTLIARGRHLEAMKEHGLTLERLWDPNPETIAVKATDMEHYEEQPDVILVCVKGYSLEDTVPFIRRVAKPDTIVIPILNIYGTGAKLQKRTAGTSGNRRMHLCICQHQRTGCVSAAWKDSADRLWSSGKDRLETGTGTDPAGFYRQCY